MIETLCLLLLIVGLIYNSYCRRIKGFPPGPTGLPFVGYYPFFDRNNPLKTITELGVKYGSIVGLKLGEYPVVITFGYDAVRESFMNEDLNGRPDVVPNRDRYEGENYGLAFHDGTFWSSQRRFTLHNFRNLGFGKKPHEVIINAEIKQLIQEFINAKGTPICIEKAIIKSTINILWPLLAGEQFNRSHPDLNTLADTVTDITHRIQITGGVSVAYPFLRYLFPITTGYLAISTASKAFLSVIKSSISLHKKKFDTENPQDFIGLYLKKLNFESTTTNGNIPTNENVADIQDQHETKSNPTDETDSSFSDKQLEGLCMDIMIGAADTSSSLMSFAVLFMCLHQDVQAKVHEELDQVVGPDRLPSLEDRHRLVLTDATITEVLRYRTPAPIVVPHRATSDTTLGGYNIPENTIILNNLSSVMMERAYWVDPEVFRPQRFITAEGGLRKDLHMMPFGKGKRVCIGESVARMSTFLLFSAIIHSFKVTLPPGHPIPDTTGTPGFTLIPPHQMVILTPRINVSKSSNLQLCNNVTTTTPIQMDNSEA